MSSTKNRINIYLPDDIMLQLRTMASREHTTISGFIANLIDEKLNRSVNDIVNEKNANTNDQVLNLLKEIKRNVIGVSHQSNAIYRNVNYSSRLLTLGCQTKQGVGGKYITKPDEEIKRVARKKALRDYGTLITADLGVEDYLDESYDEESKIGIPDGEVLNNEISSQSIPSSDSVPPKRKGIDPNKYLKK